ncbi:hypothetical protein HPB50_012307 [Hyalomma asiaticum]|uniref:Uncharacterized protein n=1 Tax=Hyalomma asiaticum TaxID=266040 RepID=A0ACB7RW96_HYAAI|nr:hypothetical protein HPB50_012307 [Hyalomma asiaticum]
MTPGYRLRVVVAGQQVPEKTIIRILELCEAQLTTQLQRLTLTPTGRDLPLRLGYISQLQDAARGKPVPDHLRATYKVAPIPRNMDPRLHQGRREARVEALEREHGHKPPRTMLTPPTTILRTPRQWPQSWTTHSQNVPVLPCGATTSLKLKKRPSRSLSPSATDIDGRSLF